MTKEDPDTARDIKVSDEVIAQADRSQWRVTIAEFCGWRRSPWDHDVWLSPGATWSEEKGVENGYWVPDSMGEGELPDYFNDLNAMHEAEKVLMKQLDYQVCNKYSGLVDDIVCRDLPTNDAMGIEFLHATAKQRAEALLRTIGKL